MSRTAARGWLVAAFVAGTASGCAGLPFHGDAGGGADARVSRAKPGVEPARAGDVLAEARRQTHLLPQEAYWPYRLAELRVAADSSAAAEAALLLSLERDPLYPPALALLSKLYFEQGRHQEAIERLESARTRARTEGAEPGFPPALLAGLALHYDAVDRIDLAATATAGVGNQGGVGLAPSLAYLALRGETPEAATDLALAALKNDPKSAVNQNNYGITRLRAGDPEAARRAFLEAVEIDPRLPGPYYNLAIVEKYYALDDEAAVRWFRLYRERAREDPDHLAEAIAGEGARAAAGGKE